MWCARVVVGTDAILLRDAGPFAQQFGIVLCISTWPVKSDQFKPLHTHTRQCTASYFQRDVVCFQLPETQPHVASGRALRQLEEFASDMKSLLPIVKIDKPLATNTSKISNRSAETPIPPLETKSRPTARHMRMVSAVVVEALLNGGDPEDL